MRQKKIDNLLQRLYQADKKLGGKAEAEENSSKLQEFEQIYSQCSQKANNVSTLQKERDQKIKKFGTDEDSIELGVAIREELQICESLVKQMQNVMLKQKKKMKKYQQNEIIVREEYLEKMKLIIKELKGKEFGEVDTPQYAQVQSFQKRVQGNINRRVELTRQDEQAMERWDKNDEQMDKKLDEIIVGADKMKENALNIGQVLSSYI